MPDTKTFESGDIVHTTDESGYAKLMLVTYVGNVTDATGTRLGVMGPLFDSWYAVNTPTGTVNVPAINTPPSGWVTRRPGKITGKLEWADNPMSEEFWKS